MPVAKIDLFKQHKSEYAATKKPALVETRPATYLVVRGRGAPGAALFEERVGVLYAMAYTLKFQSKAVGRDFAVCKLEGLYGVDGQSLADLERLDKDAWNWRLMIRMPDFLDAAAMKAAKKQLREKGKEGDFDAAALETIDEGTCVQMLHVGPYEEERRTLEAMRAFADGHGRKPRLWHHEIYLSDPRRVPPERLKTILRQPVA